MLTIYTAPTYAQGVGQLPQPPAELPMDCQTAAPGDGQQGGDWGRQLAQQVIVHALKQEHYDITMDTCTSLRIQAKQVHTPKRTVHTCAKMQLSACVHAHTHAGVCACSRACSGVY